MDWFEVLLVVIGAVLGFLLSIVTVIVERHLDRQGKLHLFYKLVHHKANSKPPQIYKQGEFVHLILPMFFEFQNTSNTSRVIRDVCLHLFKNGKQVAKMKQAQFVTSEKTRGGETVENTIIEFGGEKNSYSFVLPPLSIQRQQCCFVLQINTTDIDNMQFDEIRFCYYDECNKVMECRLLDVPTGLADKEFECGSEFTELICKKRKVK